MQGNDDNGICYVMILRSLLCWCTRMTSAFSKDSSSGCCATKARMHCICEKSEQKEKKEVKTRVINRSIGHHDKNRWCSVSESRPPAHPHRHFHMSPTYRYAQTFQQLPHYSLNRSCHKIDGSAYSSNKVPPPAGCQVEVEPQPVTPTYITMEHKVTKYIKVADIV